jgi:hypothetical protein
MLHILGFAGIYCSFILNPIVSPITHSDGFPVAEAQQNMASLPCLIEQLVQELLLAGHHSKYKLGLDNIIIEKID